ncbi:MAG: PPC domain-containing protein, partial [Planctomycetales bacterium]|nr:PPC domain-containing protein [Planctomycetales bacterium]
HALRVRTETGVSNLRLFSVGALPQVNEAEPNNDFAAPQAIALNTTVCGVVQSEDVDYFVVEAKQGQRITAELEGLRLGNTFFDPYVAILNEKRFELVRSDDAALLKQDCLCSLIAPEDGKYIVQVRESAYQGDGASKYRLHVGTFPRPTAVLPAGGKPGETLEVVWIGDAAGERKEQVTLPEIAAAEGSLLPADEQGIAPSANGVRLVDLPNAMEVEPNNAVAEATPASAPGALNGVIGAAGDTDFFKFTAKKGDRYDIRVFAREVLRTPLDPVLVVRNAQGGGVASNDDNGGSPDSYLQFTSPADGDYFVEVRDHLKSGGPDYAYRVEIAAVQPRLSFSLPEKV